MPRTYVVSIPGGTATTSIQIQQGGSVKKLFASFVSAAAGTWELSTNPLSQIASAAPASDVVARIRIGATAGMQNVVLEISVPGKAFGYLYLHCTGAGNVGELTLFQ